MRSGAKKITTGRCESETSSLYTLARNFARIAVPFSQLFHRETRMKLQRHNCQKKFLNWIVSIIIWIASIISSHEVFHIKFHGVFVEFLCFGPLEIPWKIFRGWNRAESGPAAARATMVTTVSPPASPLWPTTNGPNLATAECADE